MSSARRHRSALVRILLAVETAVIGLVLAFLVFGRAGFVGSPLSYVVVTGHSMDRPCARATSCSCSIRTATGPAR